MTHLCEIITLRPRSAPASAATNHPDRERATAPARPGPASAERVNTYNLSAIMQLGTAQGLVDAASDDIAAGLVNAEAGTRTEALGGPVNGRTISFCLRAALALIHLRNTPADHPLRAAIEAWLREGRPHG